MAHFAEIDAEDVVVRVLVVPEAEAARGEAYLRDDLGLGGRWVQTSFTGALRRRFAGPGMTWDAARDAFLLPRPYPSWQADAAGEWQPPVARPPGDAGAGEGDWDWDWDWDEAAQAWRPVPG